MTSEMFQNTFHLAFPLLMIGLPITFSLLVRTKPHTTLPADEQARQVRRWTAYLALATVAAALVHLAIWAWRPGPGAEFTWALFFPLWFMIAQPLLQAKDPGWVPRRVANEESQDVTPPVRAADLSRRDNVHYVPMWASVVAWLTWVAILVLVTVMLPPEYYWMLILPAVGGFLLASVRPMGDAVFGHGRRTSRSSRLS